MNNSNQNHIHNFKHIHIHNGNFKDSDNDNHKRFCRHKTPKVQFFNVSYCSMIQTIELQIKGLTLTVFNMLLWFWPITLVDLA